MEGNKIWNIALDAEPLILLIVCRGVGRWIFFWDRGGGHEDVALCLQFSILT